MPAISSGDAAVLRQFPQGVRRYLSAAPREAVFAAQVSGAIQRDGVSGGVIAIPYTGVTTGAYGDVISGMTLDIGTTAGGAEIGRVRVRSANGAQILTAESVLPAAAGQYLTVRREFRPWLVKPRRFEDYADAAYPTVFTEYHDYDVPYSNQNSAIAPKPNIVADGYELVKLAGFVDAGQSYRTVTLVADSTTFNGASISAWLWDVGDGTVTVGGTSLPLVTAQFPVGFRYVTLTITDSNGASGLMRLPIWVHDADHMPITEFEVTRDETAAEGGREMVFEVLASHGEAGIADSGVIPEGSAICYWEEATFGSDADPVPRYYRGQFMGWTLRDAVLFQLYRSRYTLEVAGAAGWLDRLGGLAQTLVDPGKTPTQWHEMQNLTLDKAVDYALRSYTNILTLVNFTMSGISDRAQTINLSKRSVWQQVRELVSGYYGVAGCDSLGGIWLRKHFSYYNASEKASFGMAITLTNADWTDEQGLRFPAEKSEAVGLVETNAARFDGVTTFQMASKARGQQGVAQVTSPFQIASWQDQLNHLTGHHLARLNNARPAVSLRLLGNLDALEPCWNEPLAISDAGENVRGLEIDGAQFSLSHVSVKHSNERGVPAKVVTWTLEGVTTGESGQTLDVAGVTLKPPTVKRTTGGRKLKPALLSPGTGTLAAINEDGYLYITRNFSAVSPTWTRVAISGITGYPLDFTPDPFSPRYLGTGSAVNGWLVSENEIVQIADIFGTTPSFTVQHSFSTTVGAYDGQRVIDTERSVQNFVVCVSYYPGGGTKALITTDGATWSSETTLDSGHPYSYLSPGVAVSGKAANVAYSAASNGFTFTGYKYSGGSWAAISNPNISGTGLPGWIHIPWHNNADTTVFYGASTAEPSDDRVYRADGAARTEITPSADGQAYSCRFPRSIDTCAINGNRVVMCGYGDPSGGMNQNAVFASKDRGNTWSVVYGPVTTAGADYLVVRCAGDDEDVFYLLGDAKIQYTADFGVTLQDKRGNLGDFADVYRFLNVCGG